MKKLFLLLALLSFVFTACQSGGDVEEDNGGTPSTPKIELAQQSIEVEFEPAEYEVAVTSPYSWEATAKNDWIKVVTETGIAGTKTLRFSVLRNKKMDIREGTIVVKNEDDDLVAELYVIQKAIEPNSKNAIFYTSSDGKIVTPNRSDVFGANIVSNTYENGNGIIIFDDDATSIGNYAFSGRTSLTNITIPDSITH